MFAAVTRWNFGDCNLVGPATLTYPFIHWPGGRGMLSVDLSGSGPTAKVSLQAIQSEPDDDGWYTVPDMTLSIGGISEISTTGNYLVELPRCALNFGIVLASGDSLNVNLFVLSKM